MVHQTFFNLPAPKRERILESAIHEFNSYSYEKTSINRIIELAEIPKGSFYQYFDSKEDLYILCIRQTYEKVLQIRLSHGESLLDTGYGKAVRLGIETAASDYNKEALEMIGASGHKLLSTLSHVSSSLRNAAMMEIAVDVIMPEIRKELLESAEFSGENLNFFSYLLSISEMISMDYGSRMNIPMEKMNQLTYLYMDSIISKMKKQSGNNRYFPAADRLL